MMRVHHLTMAHISLTFTCSLVFLWFIHCILRTSLRERTQILLISYSRSGSSLLGQLLVASPDSSYYFEPFYRQTYNCEVQDRDQTKEEIDRVESLVTGLLGCDRETVAEMDRFTELHGKNSKYCNMTGLSVVKTIRLHRNRLESWIHKKDWIKVVHLVRDPRDQFVSRIRPEIASDFECVTKNISHYCHIVADDLDLGSLLPSPKHNIEQLLTWAGWEFDRPVIKYVDTRPENYKIVETLYPWRGPTITTMEKYIDMRIPPERKILSTRSRNTNYSTLSKEILHSIERDCGTLLDRLHYPRILPV